MLKGFNYISYVKGKTGIIYFEDYWQRAGEQGRTGDHIDLINARGTMASIGAFRTWLRTTFPNFSENWADMSDLKRSKKVIFWEVK